VQLVFSFDVSRVGRDGDVRPWRALEALPASFLVDDDDGWQGHVVRTPEARLRQQWNFERDAFVHSHDVSVALIALQSLPVEAKDAHPPFDDLGLTSVVHWEVLVTQFARKLVQAAAATGRAARGAGDSNCQEVCAGADSVKPVRLEVLCCCGGRPKDVHVQELLVLGKVAPVKNRVEPVGFAGHVFAAIQKPVVESVDDPVDQM